MFRGSSTHNLDDKGRIMIPARFREVISASGDESIMVTRMDGALFAYALPEWSKIEARLMSVAETSESMRRFRRAFIGGAFDCTLDKQNRILIPPVLRDYAELRPKKEVMLVGQLNHFEIWSSERYEKELKQLEADLKKEDVAVEVAKLGL